MTALRLLKWLIYLAAIGAIAWGAAWVANHPGDIALTWFGYRIEIAIGPFLALLAILLFAIFAVWRLLSFFWRLPGDLWEARAEARNRKGYLALSRGLAAASGGDVAEARRLAQAARKWLGEAPLVHLLAAQAAQLGHDEDGAARHFAALAEAPETALLGLRGLAGQAGKAGDDKGALALADRALAHHPQAIWAAELVHRLAAKLGDFATAERGLKALQRAGGISAEGARRRSAALAAEQARLALTIEGKPEEAEAAFAASRAALKKAGDFVPARYLLARWLIRRGKSREAGRLIEQIWDDHPHDLLGRLFLETLADERPIDRARRCESLARANPDHPATHALLAAASLAAELFGPARRHLARLVEIERETSGLSAATARAFAKLEEAETGQMAKIRPWLEEAAQALPDAAWICGQCGEIADAGPESGHWQLLCRHCGAIDSLNWQRPRSGPARETGDLLALRPAHSAEPAASPAPGPGPAGSGPADRQGALSVDAARLIN